MCMTRENAQRALNLLAPIGKGIVALSELPGLESTDIALLQHLSGRAILFARRMEAKATGQNMANAIEALEQAAKLAAQTPVTERMQ